jgi:hypothetical protein
VLHPEEIQANNPANVDRLPLPPPKRRATPTPSPSQLVRLLAALALTATLAPTTPAHTPVLDSLITDWCVGAPSYLPEGQGGMRVEDASATLICGNCDTTTDLACLADADCPGGETCINVGSKTEVVWWDNRTDAAVNDLATLAFTRDNDNLYVMIGLWTDPDPILLPFMEFAIDYTPGGLGVWHDPNAALVAPGYCSVSTDRGCTSDVDCHFCQLSQEPFPSTRVRPCGMGCDPDIGDTCDTSQVCLNVGSTHIDQLGTASNPASEADHLLVFDLGLWLVGAGDSILLMEPGTIIDPASPWDPVTGCTPDHGLDNDWCDVEPIVNPGPAVSGGGPPGVVEFAVPWSHFGCTGCPDACSCPGFGPGLELKATLLLSRGLLTLDYSPGGPIEDVLSEATAGTYTTQHPMVGCPQQVTSDTEEILGKSVDRRESARLSRGLEPSHLSFPLAGRLVGDSRPIVRVSAGVVDDGRHDRPVRGGIAPQLVGDQPPGLISLTFQQLLGVVAWRSRDPE